MVASQRLNVTLCVHCMSCYPSSRRGFIAEADCGFCEVRNQAKETVVRRASSFIDCEDSRSLRNSDFKSLHLRYFDNDRF